VLFAVGLMLAGPACVLAQQDPVASARTLAYDGKHVEALSALEEHLRQHPDDTDALTLYGTILSWDKRYDEGRRALQTVLKHIPNHGDALAALINLELWAGNPSRAEELASTALLDRPKDTSLLLARARALQAMERTAEAIRALDQLLAIDPNQTQAQQLRDNYRDNVRLWDPMIDQSYEWFNHGQSSWFQTQASIKRQTEKAGAVIVRFSHAARFGFDSNLAEIEAFPTLRKGTYADLDVGWSPDGILFSRYSASGELYQSLPEGFEVSGGFRRLGFASPLNVYTGSFSKYYHSWLLGARTYVTPASTGDSQSLLFSARRFFGDGVSYVGLRYGFGAAPTIDGSVNEIEVLRSQSILGEVNRRLTRRWTFTFRGSHSVEDRTYIKGLHHEQADGSFDFRF
jgi:YaiO family outer membrane protein